MILQCRQRLRMRSARRRMASMLMVVLVEVMGWRRFMTCSMMIVMLLMKTSNAGGQHSLQPELFTPLTV